MLLAQLWWFAERLWTVFAAPEDEVRQLKVAFEGPQGLAGPNAQVIEIRRVWMIEALLDDRTERRYAVSVRLSTGEMRQRIARLKPGLFGAEDIMVE
ncbi:MAG: hypothetical protein P4L64_05020 [Caulobacteraceae bacterium]|nr:hypothetical protein [Caulobacteraceae bacterium]